MYGAGVEGRGGRVQGYGNLKGNVEQQELNWAAGWGMGTRYKKESGES